MDVTYKQHVGPCLLYQLVSFAITIWERTSFRLQVYQLVCTNATNRKWLIVPKVA